MVTQEGPRIRRIILHYAVLATILRGGWPKVVTSTLPADARIVGANAEHEMVTLYVHSVTFSAVPESQAIPQYMPIFTAHNPTPRTEGHAADCECPRCR